MALSTCFSLSSFTDKKGNKIFLIYKEIQTGSASSYMVKCLRISSYIRRPFLYILFPSPVKNLGSSQLKILPQYFYSSKNDGFMKNFFLYIFDILYSQSPIHSRPVTRPAISRGQIFSNRPVFWIPALYKAGWQPCLPHI